MENKVFFFFSILTLICGTSVITSQNPIHSVLFLVLVFFNVASLMILLGVEFLALLFVIVYVGAVAVLFLFIIMMLSVKIQKYKTVTYRYVPIGIALGSFFLIEILIIFNNEVISLVSSPFTCVDFNSYHFNPIVSWSSETIFVPNVKVIGSVLYTHYSLLFVLAGLILLVSMIGAITLTLYRRGDIKRQEIFKQIQQDFESTIDYKLCVKKR